MGSEPACTPPSTAGYPFAGTCSGADHCDDQYDTALGASLLQQMCESQGGTWSTTPCNAASWNKRCWQELMGGVYVLYMPEDGICAFGCEEPL